MELSGDDDAEEITERIRGQQGHSRPSPPRTGGRGQRPRSPPASDMRRTRSNNRREDTGTAESAAGSSRYRIPRRSSPEDDKGSTWRLMLNIWPLEDRPEVRTLDTTQYMPVVGKIAIIFLKKREN